MNDKEQALRAKYARILGKSPDELTEKERAIVKKGAKSKGWKPAPLGPGGHDPNKTQ